MIRHSFVRSPLCALLVMGLMTCLAGCPGTVPGMTGNGNPQGNNPPANPNPNPPANPDPNPNPSPSPSPNPPAPPAVTPTLFITNTTGNRVISYANPSGVNGNIIPDTVLEGTQTDLNVPSSVIVDSNGAMLVTNFFGPTASITSYNDAVSTNGNLAPDRNVQGPATTFDFPRAMALSGTNDLLFVSDAGVVDKIMVFADASTAAFNGNLAPIRTITSTGTLTNPIGIALDGSDNLYVCNNTPKQVVVFANASTLNGDTAPTRIIASAAFDEIIDVFVDATDTLYVVNGLFTPQVHVFFNAFTLNGSVTPDSTLTLDIAAASFLWGIAVDAAGTGYIADINNQAIYSYDSLATRNGMLPPDRTIAGPNTLLHDPMGLFILE